MQGERPEPEEHWMVRQFDSEHQHENDLCQCYDIDYKDGSEICICPICNRVFIVELLTPKK